MTVQLQLFIAGDSSRAANAESSLRELCDRVWPDDYELDVVDVLEDPDRADDAHVLATPLVLKTAPAPERRVVGDLSDINRLARALNVTLPDEHLGGQP